MMLGLAIAPCARAMPAVQASWWLASSKQIQPALELLVAQIQAGSVLPWATPARGRLRVG